MLGSSNYSCFSPLLTCCYGFILVLIFLPGFWSWIPHMKRQFLNFIIFYVFYFSFFLLVVIIKFTYTNSINLHIYLEFCYSKGFNLNPCIYTMIFIFIFIFVLFTLSYSIRCLKKPGGMHVHKVKPLSKMKNMDPALNCWQFYFFHFSLGLKFKVIV